MIAKAAKALKKAEPPKLCGLGMRVTEEAPHRIVELIEGGAAKQSHKLMVGDHILKIAGRETKSLSMSQVAACCFPIELLLCTFP